MQREIDAAGVGVADIDRVNRRPLIHFAGDDALDFGAEISRRESFQHTTLNLGMTEAKT